MEEIDPTQRIGKFSCIYLIKNIINGKIYIGQAKDFKDRWRRHKNFTHGRKLKHAIMKYGFEAFRFYILERVDDRSLLDQREQYYLDLYQPFGENGYNICKIAGTSAGYKHTEETKEQMKKSRAKLNLTGENNPNYGNKWTQEQKDVISRLNAGRWLGRKHTKTAKEKCRSAKLGENNPNAKEWILQNISTQEILTLRGGVKRLLSKSKGSSYFKLLHDTDPNWKLLQR
jgi:group I intron endonuclease